MSDIFVRAVPRTPVASDFENVVTHDGGFTRIYLVVDSTTGRPYSLVGTTVTAIGLGSGSTSGTNTGDVTLAGTPNYITLAGQVLTLTRLDLVDDINTFTSAQLASMVTDETGSGALVFATSPTLVTPVLGVASATSVNKVAITAPAGSATLTIADGKTLTVNGSITFVGTDGTTMTFPGTSATLARTDAANTFTGHQTIEGVTSTGATGTGKLVFDNTPTLITPVIGVATGTSLAATGKLTSSSPSAKIGYATGAGTTASQGAGSGKATAVTLNACSGTVTMNGAALAARGIVSFTLNDTAIAAGDHVLVTHESVGTIGAYTFQANTHASNSCVITVTNNSAGSLSEAIVLKITVLAGVNA